MLDFIKMQGTGNNYIYIDCINKNMDKYNFKEISKEISNVNYGIGSDGLILICNSKVADAKMVMYNKDGSEGKMCGNGIRCAAKYLYENYCKKEEITIETKSGIKEIKLLINDNNVESIVVDMGYPIFDCKDIPVDISYKNLINEKIKFGNEEIFINCLSVGNPHTVIFVDNLDNINIEYLGNLIQKNKIFPEGCNVEFVEIINENKINMRVFERGSGETFSCGTGACASVVAGVLNGLLRCNEEIEVNLKGGTLYITYNDKIYMKGPAEFICKGKYLVKKHFK